MFKKIKAAILSAAALLLVCCLLTACVGASWSGQRIMSISTINDSDLSLSVDRFDGGVTYTVRVREGQNAMLAEVELEEGTLEVIVTDPSGGVCFEAPINYSSTFGITLPRTGLYKIIIAADGFRGAYRFNWGDEGPDLPYPVEDDENEDVGDYGDYGEEAPDDGYGEDYD